VTLLKRFHRVTLIVVPLCDPNNVLMGESNSEIPQRDPNSEVPLGDANSEVLLSDPNREIPVGDSNSEAPLCQV